MVSKTNRFLETMAYFGLREWHIANENVVRLRTLLTPTEASMLEFDLSTIDWDEYFQSYIPGIRRYFLAEPEQHKERPITSGSKGIAWHRSLGHTLGARTLKLDRGTHR
uniref:Fatty acyl-CoA reductase C-terminal domain-containing protein n=1 Tax=Anopheles maculatus TaxID=74869 RepID=A0A182SG80_9DIPT